MLLALTKKLFIVLGVCDDVVLKPMKFEISATFSLKKTNRDGDRKQFDWLGVYLRSDD